MCLDMRRRLASARLRQRTSIAFVAVVNQGVPVTAIVGAVFAATRVS
jgi:hypothetical protein